MNIKAFNINTSAKSRGPVNRNYQIIGDTGSVFHMIIQDSAGQYYNFPENTIVDKSISVFAPAGSFSTTPASLHNKQIPNNGIYQGVVSFPDSGGDNNYTITITAGNNTTFDTNVFTNDKIFVSDKIYSYQFTGINFSVTHSESAVVEPAVIAFKGKSSEVGNLNISNKVAINWPFTLSSGSATILRQPVIDDFEFTTTSTTISNSDVTGETIYIELADVSGLSIGMGVTGDGIAANAVIRKIIPGYRDYNSSTTTNFIYRIPLVENSDGNDLEESSGGTIQISNASSWTTGVTLTFLGKGSSAVETFNKTRFKINNFKIELDNVRTITTDSTADTVIHTNSAAGIKAQSQFTANGSRTGDFVIVDQTITQVGVGQRLQSVSSGTLVGIPTVTSVDVDSKKIFLSTRQTYSDGATLTFSNSIAKGIGLQNETTDPFVVSISTNDVTVNANQVIENGAGVIFTGSSRAGKISGEIEMLEYGNSNLTLDLNFDNILNLD